MSPLRASLQGAIEARPSLKLHLARQTLADLPFGPRPEPARGNLRRAMVYAVRDVVACNDEVLAHLILSTQHDVDMGLSVSQWSVATHSSRSRGPAPPAP